MFLQIWWETWSNDSCPRGSCHRCLPTFNFSRALSYSVTRYFIIRGNFPFFSSGNIRVCLEIPLLAFRIGWNVCKGWGNITAEELVSDGTHKEGCYDPTLSMILKFFPYITIWSYSFPSLQVLPSTFTNFLFQKREEKSNTKFKKDKQTQKQNIITRKKSHKTHEAIFALVNCSWAWGLPWSIWLVYLAPLL